MKRAVVILGAGASYDVHNASVPITNDRAQPPLARELFESRFWQQRQRYPGAAVVGSELGALATQPDPFDLEQQLTRYAESTNPQMLANYRHVPGYLRDVLVFCATAYVPAPANYIRLVSRLLDPLSHEIMFVVLNYDTMLEVALRTYDSSRFHFKNLTQYTQDPSAQVIKVHGSTSWLVPIPASQNEPWLMAASRYEPEPEDIVNLQVIELVSIP
jgi:hypothetical protein